MIANDKGAVPRRGAGFKFRDRTCEPCTRLSVLPRSRDLTRLPPCRVKLVYMRLLDLHLRRHTDPHILLSNSSLCASRGG